MSDLHQLKREIAQDALNLREVEDANLQASYEALVQKLDKFVWIAERKNRNDPVRQT